jgi:hypothetical protein
MPFISNLPFLTTPYASRRMTFFLALSHTPSCFLCLPPFLTHLKNKEEAFEE